MEISPRQFGVAFLTLLSYCFLLPCPAVGQEPNEQQRQEDLRAVIKQTQDAIDKIRPALFNGLTGHDLVVYKQIKEFRVTNKDSLSEAWSNVDSTDGRRIVVIDVGYGRQIYFMSQAYMIEQVEQRPIVVPYIQYVVTSWHNRSSFVKGPPDYANFDFDKILDDPKLSAEFGGMNASALAFIMAHEVGHHVLGHWDGPRPKDPAMLREMEIAADAWALKCLRSANPRFSPLGGVLPVIFGYYVSPTPIDTEQHSNHPSDLRRLQIIFKAMEDALPDYREDIEKQGASYDDFKAFVEKSLSEYEGEIETDSPPVRPYPGDGASGGAGPFNQPKASAPRPAPTAMVSYCGDIYGKRFCPMSVSAPVGTQCGCPGVPGWGVAVP